MGSNGGTARERVESAARERGRVRVGAVGAMMVTPRLLLCLLGALLASSVAQEQELAREGKQLSSQPEQKYDLEFSFPVDSVLATNVNDDRRARIDNLIQEILLATQDEQVNSLPGTLLDPSSIIFEEDYRCEDGKTTRTKSALSKDECRDDCPDGQQLSFTGECETCPVGTYRTQGLHRGCQNCQSGRTSLRPGSTSEADCSVPVCIAGQFLNATDNQCQACPIGTFQPEE